MMVGSAMSGKSAIIETLKLALTRQNEKGSKLKVFDIKLNPKSVNIFQLYGIFDAETKCWIEGVFPKILRDFT